MKKFTIGVLMALSVFSISPAFSASGDEALTPAQQEAVRQAVQDYLQGQGTPEAARPPMPQPGTAPDPPDSGKNLQDLGAIKGKRQKADSSMQGSGGLIYARPFVSSPKAIVGGYMDIEYFNRANQGNSYFDQHRLVPFIYGDISERVKFAAEIEFEHGTNDIKVEFATIDYLVQEPFNVRAGIILVPLGKFNLLHDAPLRDLTERPLVNQRIIPTTLHQPGVGAYGTFYPTALSKLDYEFYVTNGFTNAFGGNGNPNNTSNINQTNGIRSARSDSTSFDNNNGKSIMGRVAFSPVLGVEVGGSGFYGNYGTNKDDQLAIWALDWTFQRGPFELIGESAWAYVKDNDLNQDGTRNGNPRRMQGYYIQGNYHFLPEFLTRMAPTFFKQEVSTFTAVVRWEQMNLGQDLNDNTEAGKLGEWQRWTFGLNFRPTEDTVFKADFQYTPVGRSGNERIHDTAFVASMATYF
ncbi:porin [Candidatus Nitrospira allomarina]|uniref:Porin n=1 Tax=Candidatus Nitrospira allomarina TaxID=3020900 RepID=A0AA96JTH6_9BACT|nr:porin [Candidatus Nitrospira allomarina]WNM59548.1 porin [Candidatus Nitrospira allomarina]